MKFAVASLVSAALASHQVLTSFDTDATSQTFEACVTDMASEMVCKESGKTLFETTLDATSTRDWTAPAAGDYVVADGVTVSDGTLVCADATKCLNHPAFIDTANKVVQILPEGVTPAAGMTVFGNCLFQYFIGDYPFALASDTTVGGSFQTGTPTVATTMQACQASCIAEPTCALWTFLANPALADGASATCFMQTDAALATITGTEPCKFDVANDVDDMFSTCTDASTKLCSMSTGYAVSGLKSCDVTTTPSLSWQQANAKACSGIVDTVVFDQFSADYSTVPQPTELCAATSQHNACQDAAALGYAVFRAVDGSAMLTRDWTTAVPTDAVLVNASYHLSLGCSNATECVSHPYYSDGTAVQIMPANETAAVRKPGNDANMGNCLFNMFVGDVPYVAAGVGANYTVAANQEKTVQACQASCIADDNCAFFTLMASNAVDDNNNTCFLQSAAAFDAVWDSDSCHFATSDTTLAAVSCLDENSNSTRNACAVYQGMAVSGMKTCDTKTTPSATQFCEDPTPSGVSTNMIFSIVSTLALTAGVLLI